MMGRFVTEIATCSVIRWMTPAMLAWGLVGCSRTPDEPAGASRTASSARAKAYEPLSWAPSAVWTVKESGSGERKAVYRVAPVGDDKDEAEIMVMHFGTGSQGDVEASYAQWYAQFDGDAKALAKHERFESGPMKVRIVEWAGTYKVPLGPQGPKGRPAMQVIKEGYRIVGGVVETPKRGNWFFRLVGPDDTVQAARSDFVAMVKAAH